MLLGGLGNDPQIDEKDDPFIKLQESLLAKKDKVKMKLANKSTINKENLRKNILPLLRENIEKRKIIQEILLHQLAYLFNTRNY